MRKILTYSGFLGASIADVVAFITANTYIQLIAAAVFYPLVIFIAYKLFISKKRKVPAQAASVPPAPVKETEPQTAVVERESSISISDIDKRAFLKLIGAAGLSFFVYSLLNRRSETLFFGKALEPGITSLEDSTGRKIDPAERQPTDSYLISEIDDEYIAFYGFTNNNGGWFIMKEDPDNGSFRYSKGEVDFSGNWSSREKLNYDYFHNIF